MTEKDKSKKEKIERHILSVFRSNRFIYASILNKKGQVIATSSDIKIKTKMTKTERAREVGKNIAALALKKNIKTVAFDRRGYKYHGRVKALAEGARASGLQF